MVNGKSHPGNKHGLKLKEADVRQLAFKQYLKHLEEGWPKEAFVFEHPVLTVCWKTLEKYIEQNPAEFPPHLREAAEIKRYRYWLTEGRALMQGRYKNGSPHVWQTCMRNMFRNMWSEAAQFQAPEKTSVDTMADHLDGKSN